MHMYVLLAEIRQWNPFYPGGTCVLAIHTAGSSPHPDCTLCILWTSGFDPLLREGRGKRHDVPFEALLPCRHGFFSHLIHEQHDWWSITLDNYFLLWFKDYTICCCTLQKWTLNTLKPLRKMLLGQLIRPHLACSMHALRKFSWRPTLNTNLPSHYYLLPRIYVTRSSHIYLRPGHNRDAQSVQTVFAKIRRWRR